MIPNMKYLNILFSSLNRNKKGILLILFSAGTLATGQLVWKISGYDPIPLITGFFMYGIGAIMMIIAYRYGSLTVLHPFMATSYFFAFIFGSLFLSEIITLSKIIGLCLILIGVFLIGGGDDK